MAESVIRWSPLPTNSVSRSNAFLAPVAGTVFFTIAATDLPSGYYKFDTIVGIAPNMGSGNGALADTRNFRINISGFSPFIPQALLNNSVRSEGYITLSGSQSITCAVGDINATASMIYSMSVFLTRLV